MEDFSNYREFEIATAHVYYAFDITDHENDFSYLNSI